MKGWWLVLLWVVSLEIQAGEMNLEAESTLPPVYPRTLQRAGITGDVQVSFIAHADGSVSEVSVLHSDHPQLADAAVAAVRRWRFKPWTVSADTPATQDVRAPLAFRFKAPAGINQWLKALKCRSVNEHLAATAEDAWVDALPFHYTRAYLTNTISPQQLPAEQRLALIAKLNRRVSDVVVRCRERPMSNFAGFLPEEIRRLL
ncbi:TonB family protein [Pseudomonas sp. efr-133-TYG-5]|uniref:TonB family protein n=1 Tax=Pseudomonas sp. efr-133-TYG-5 TaxID=3040310 RepID=UPI00255222BC|nr:TonB family protein [Pseudomonas sp. efr-133-TYG-5]